jgi:hypothetical protein
VLCEYLQHRFVPGWKCIIQNIILAGFQQNANDVVNLLVLVSTVTVRISVKCSRGIQMDLFCSLHSCQLPHHRRHTPLLDVRCRSCNDAAIRIQQLQNNAEQLLAVVSDPELELLSTSTKLLPTSLLSGLLVTPITLSFFI